MTTTLLAAPPAAAVPTLPAAIEAGLQALAQLPLPNDVTFYSGQLGHVLLYGYAYKLTGDDHHWDQLMQALDGILHKLQAPATAYLAAQPGLLPKLGYVLQLLARDGIVDVDLGAHTLAQFDDLIYQHALGYLRARNIDFLYGAAGALHYLGTRVGARPEVSTYLAELLAELLLTRIEDERGIRFLNAHINHLNGNADLNIGLAHGHCGLLLVLLGLHETGVLPAQTGPLAHRMVDYLLALEVAPEPHRGRMSSFPLRHHDELPLLAPQNRNLYSSRMGWCYGDLNAVQALYQAHRVLHRPDALAAAHRVGELSCARRTEPESGVDSPHLCHGSASLLLCYQRLYQQHPLPCYREAQAYWLHHTLAQLPATYAEAPTAFQATGLLMGLPGLLLVLISEELAEPLAWPQLFLL
jgi:hypothetical protein